MFKNIYLRGFCIALAGIGIAPCVFAQNFPTKPVRFVIGPAPEMLPRLVSQKLSELWGHQVVVDQRPGAGGIVAGDLVSKATADGYTWLMSTGSFYVVDALYPKLSYNMVRDFTPVTLIAVPGPPRLGRRLSIPDTRSVAPIAALRRPPAAGRHWLARAEAHECCLHSRDRRCPASSPGLSATPQARS